MSLCCASLSAALGPLVSYPSQLSYNKTEAAYFSTQEASLTPSCIVHPASAQDVASAVSIIVPAGCEFAIKGGGHAAAAGWANINGGVTIDMEGLHSLSINANHSVVSVGAGARWEDVFAYLDPYGVQAAGGRNAQVGVGGLLIGGGISVFSGREGFSCDNIVNFEVVLANGQLTNANQTYHPDLYRALKGGTNNFGVVTRYDLATFPQGNISVTNTINEITEREAIFNAFTKIADASDFDVYSALVVALFYNSSDSQWLFNNAAVYTKPVLHPPVYDELVSIPSVSVTSKITTLPIYSNSTQFPQLHWLYSSVSFAPSTELMMGIFDVMNETFSSVNPAGGVVWFAHFEAMPSVMLAKSAKNGGNVLGLKPEDGNGIVMLISAFWPEASASEEVNRAGRSAITKVQKLAKKKGLLWDYQYMNYAAPYQDVIKSYGPESVAFLQKVAKKYDPGKVFQKQVPGGYKLPRGH